MRKFLKIVFTVIALVIIVIFRAMARNGLDSFGYFFRTKKGIFCLCALVVFVFGAYILGLCVKKRNYQKGMKKVRKDFVTAKIRCSKCYALNEADRDYCFSCGNQLNK